MGMQEIYVSLIFGPSSH